MTRARRNRQNPEVREFILRNVEENSASIARLTSEKFNLSRQAIIRYIRKLIDDGLLYASGNTSARKYSLKTMADVAFTIEGITASSDEDTVWRFRILPNIPDIPKNILDICQYGFTEIFNNVIDHSISNDAIVSYEQDYCKINIIVIDSGIGIFEKIQRDFNLPDPRIALLELSKGRLTSDKTRHTGEGIFFTSRMFDQFCIRSGNLFYTRTRVTDDEWLVETGPTDDPKKGTGIFMRISTDANWTTRQIFDRYQEDDLRFRKTHVPIKLGMYPGEQLVSRSQAKRVLARFEDFSEVLLDFDGVEDIGQAFADEIFRVFPLQYPDTELIAIRATPAVKRTINRVTQGAENGPQQSFPF